MYLQKLSIVNYKNIQEATVCFSPRLNCFFGENGQGKTNFLDAVYYLSFCKSHSNPIDSQNILHTADFLMLQGDYVENDKVTQYYCGIKRRQKKVFKHDKKEYERLSEHIGCLPLVLISPSDEALIQDGSDERRRFMDMGISQYDHSYMNALLIYNNALQQRNALLKNEMMNIESSLFDIYEEPMAEQAEIIYQKRKNFIDDFMPVFNRYYQEISGGKEHVGLHYCSQLEKGSLLEQLQATRERDIIIGYTTKGTHKDDIEMSMDEFPIKRVGSQGQNKTYLIALKLAQFDFLKKAGKKTPILLLDDIFDKLDAGRVKQIIQLVAQENFGQIFIADTHREHLNLILQEVEQEHKIFYIQQGEITEIG